MAFTGSTLEINLAHTDGMVGDTPITLVGLEQLIDAKNVTFSTGTLDKEGGATKYTTGPLAGGSTIIGAWDWWPNSTTQRLVALTSNGSAYKDTGDGAFSVILRAGQAWTSVNTAIFAEGGKEAAANNSKLFIATGAQAIQVLSADGATIADLATPAADWASSYPTFVLNHEGRLWGGGNSNQPHTLYYSTATDMENFTGGGSGTVAVYPGEGQYIATAVSYKGLIVVFKYPRGIYIVDTTDPSSANWKVRKIAQWLGIAGIRAWTMVEDDILFMDPAGNFHLLSAVQEFGYVSSAALSVRTKFRNWASTGLNPAAFTKARGAFSPLLREAHFAIAGVGSSTNNYRVVWDFNGPRPRWHYSDFPSCVDIFTRLDSSAQPYLFTASNAGHIWALQQGTYLNGSSSYDGTFQTSHIDFSVLAPALAQRRKNFRFLELVGSPTGNWTLTVNVYIDGVLSQALAFNMGTSGTALGTFVLDTDSLGGGEVLTLKKRLVGSGRRISFQVTQSGSGQNFQLYKMIVYFDPGSERI